MVFCDIRPKKEPSTDRFYGFSNLEAHKRVYRRRKTILETREGYARRKPKSWRTIMNKRPLFMLCVLFLVPLSVMGQNPFDGTWKLDVNSIQFDPKANVYLLQSGMYDCQTCVPPIKIKADGTDQKVIGDPYNDRMSFKVIDEHNAETTSKKDGKIVGTSKYVVSADGNTLTTDWTYSGNPNSGTQTGHYTEKRVGMAPSGAHLISGSWQFQTQNASENTDLIWTYKVSGNEMAMTSRGGQSYTAKLDGTDAQFKGDPGTTSVSARMIGKNKYEETLKRDGKVITVNTSTISDDGMTLSIVSEDKLQGRTDKAQAHKQ